MNTKIRNPKRCTCPICGTMRAVEAINQSQGIYKCLACCEEFVTKSRGKGLRQRFLPGQSKFDFS